MPPRNAIPKPLAASETASTWRFIMPPTFADGQHQPTLDRIEAQRPASRSERRVLRFRRLREGIDLRWTPHRHATNFIIASRLCGVLRFCQLDRNLHAVRKARGK